MVKKGFSLIELVMVMIIVGILSVMGMLAINNSLQAVELGAAADKLAADLRYAQAMAGSSALWHGVSFESAPGNRYSLFTTTGAADTLIDNPAKRGNNFTIELNTDYEVAIGSVNIAGGAKVEFSPDGTPYNDKNGSAITVEGVVTLTKNAASRTVRITPNTGRIYIP